ncbi:MAG: hypothetical protein WBN04_13065 [Paracoccaceae bacterium]
MIQPEPIGLLNTGLPVAVLSALAALLPRVFIERDTRSQRRLAVGIFSTALSLFVLGAAIFGVVYALRGSPVGAALTQTPFASMMVLLRLSALSAIIWLPILALTWFSAAQSVERRRGEDIMRGNGA